MPKLVPTPADDPESRHLLEHYFTERARGFRSNPHGYVTNWPEAARFEPPQGLFLLLRDDRDEAIGCGGIRRIDDLDGLVTYEVKHIWIEPAGRGKGWSRLIMDELEQRALGFGAEQLVLDTNESLSAAQHLYQSSGYETIAAYNDNPNATHWFRKRLEPDADTGD